MPNKANNEQEPLRIYIRFKSYFTDKLDQFYILVKKKGHVPPKMESNYFFMQLYICVLI